jgi:curved DNA-binding protein
LAQTEKEIKSAYRKLARQLHPDLNAGDKAASERFKAVNEANDVLSDKKKRKDYDEFGENWKHADELRKAGASRFSGGRGRGGNPFSSGDSIFEQFFTGNGGSIPFDQFGGHGFSRQGPAKIEGSVDITLKEAYEGATRRVSLSGPAGSRNLEVTIPAGISDGAKIRLNPDANTRVLLTVNVLPHSAFTRTGDDLTVEAPVSYIDAVLGGEVEVPTMTGRIVLTIPVGTQNGRSFRIPKKGMPRRNKEGFGDLIARVKIRMPESITDEHMRLFEQLRDIERPEPAGSAAGTSDQSETEGSC